MKFNEETELTRLLSLVEEVEVNIKNAQDNVTEANRQLENANNTKKRLQHLIIRKKSQVFNN